jgi:lipopolysaccharide kinase (Kdo/WaaP) family protein
MRLGHSTAEGGLFFCARSLARRVDCDPALPPDLIETLLRGDPDQLIAESELLQIKERCAAARLDHPAGPLLIKRHDWGDWRRTARMLLRVPTSRASATLGLELVKQGVITPRPRASLECGIGPFGYRSYLLTDFVEGTTLHRYIRSGNTSPEILADLAHQAAANWQRLIDLRISHNDLKPENFIVDAAAKLWIIDFERPRRHRDVAGLRERHLADLVRFLHVRSWRSDPAAAAAFRAELLKTSLGQWLSASRLQNHPGLQSNYLPQQLACGLSVVIMLPESNSRGSTATTSLSIEAAIGSASDIADEILVVSPTSPGAWHVVRRIDHPGQPNAFNNATEATRRNQANTGRPSHPWVLVLRSGDRVTPELARQLPEQIVDRTDCDAFRIPIEERAAGRRASLAASSATAPIRLFHQRRCSFSVRRGEVTVAADPSRIGQFVDKIYCESHAATIAKIAGSQISPIGAVTDAPSIRRAA